jgi:hypothetical protein
MHGFYFFFAIMPSQTIFSVLKISSGSGNAKKKVIETLFIEIIGKWLNRYKSK